MNPPGFLYNFAAPARGLMSADPPNWAQIATLIASTAIAFAAFLVSRRVARDRRAREQHDDREEIRKDLREWFQGLSHSAPAEGRRRSDVLRSQIEEMTDAYDYSEIVTLMAWAREMLEKTRSEFSARRLSYKEAHLRRIIIKRRFRQFIAVWAGSRTRGKRIMRRYIGQGWAAVVSESIEAASSSTHLSRNLTWPSWRRFISAHSQWGRGSKSKQANADRPVDAAGNTPLRK